jgi:hypothetical protein
LNAAEPDSGGLRSMYKRMGGSSKDSVAQGSPVDWAEADRSLQAEFASTMELGQAHYERLFAYFLTGWVQRRTPDGAYAVYPGAPSRNGRHADLLEGFTRILPLLSVWLVSGRNPFPLSVDNERQNLADMILAGLASGTDPNSTSYWGDMADGDQRIVEASDVALAVWMLRDGAWRDFGHTRRRSVLEWLAQAGTARVPDNNWHLIVVFITAVLRALGFPITDSSMEEHYQRFKSFYLGAGWFSDGPRSKVDFYNAWQIHYLLHWMTEVDPQFDATFIRQALADFVATFKYLIGPRGIPIMGRSVCYRLAAPAPLIAAAMRSEEGIAPGLAHRACDSVWHHFLLRGAVQRGSITQGYYGTNLSILDNYSGPASALLSLRSLVLMLACEPSFWTHAHVPLLVEEGDYSVRVPEIGWTIEGTCSTGNIVIRQDRFKWGKLVFRQPYTPIHRVLEWAAGRPLRPPNEAVKYRKRLYSSQDPFCS